MLNPGWGLFILESYCSELFCQTEVQSLELFVLYLVLVLPLCACICEDVFVEVQSYTWHLMDMKRWLLNHNLEPFGGMYEKILLGRNVARLGYRKAVDSSGCFMVFLSFSVVCIAVSHIHVALRRRLHQKIVIILDARVQRSILSMPTNTYFGNVANQKHEFRANVVLNRC